MKNDVYDELLNNRKQIDELEEVKNSLLSIINEEENQNIKVYVKKR